MKTGMDILIDIAKKANNGAEVVPSVWYYSGNCINNYELRYKAANIYCTVKTTLEVSDIESLIEKPLGRYGLSSITLDDEKCFMINEDNYECYLMPLKKVEGVFRKNENNFNKFLSPSIKYAVICPEIKITFPYHKSWRLTDSSVVIEGDSEIELNSNQWKAESLDKKLDTLSGISEQIVSFMMILSRHQDEIETLYSHYKSLNSKFEAKNSAVKK
ncbi:MAG: hypothetical protein WC376_02330 [Candidatus Nanoarchaeia archaeon]